MQSLLIPEEEDIKNQIRETRRDELKNALKKLKEIPDSESGTAVDKGGSRSIHAHFACYLKRMGKKGPPHVIQRVGVYYSEI